MKKKTFNPSELSEELKKAGFSIKGKPVSGKFVSKKFGLIDFRKMKVKQAEYLVANEFEFLKKDSKDTGKRVSN